MNFKIKHQNKINGLEPGNSANAAMSADNGDPQTTSFRSSGRRSVSITKNPLDAEKSKTINVYRKDRSLKKTKNIKTGRPDEEPIEKTTHKYKEDGSLKTTKMNFKQSGELFSHTIKRHYMPGVQEPTSDKSKIKHLHVEDSRPVSKLNPIRKYKKLKTKIQNLRGDTTVRERLDEHVRSKGN